MPKPIKYFVLIITILVIAGCAGRIPDGINPSYYPDGTLKAETTFLKNKKHGLTKEYYQNGRLKAEYNYEKNILQGETKEYFNNERNTLMKVLNYKLGAKNGPAVEYYPSGVRKWEGKYLSDELTGNVITYYENGTKKEEANYSIGQKHESVKTFYDNGNIKTDEIWLNNRKHKVIYYNQDGSIRHTQEF